MTKNYFNFVTVSITKTRLLFKLKLLAYMLFLMLAEVKRKEIRKKAYEFVRKTFLKALPHVATVRKWFSRIGGGPGFSEEALELLQKHVKVSGPQKELIVALTVDEMKIKKQFEFDDKTSQFIGYSDIGSGDFYKLPVNLFFSILRIYELSSSHFIDAYLLPNS